MAENNKDSIKLTKGQENAVNDLINFVNGEWKDTDYCHALCGPGGTGKTFVVKYIINNCKFNKSLIMCTAPTHKACRVFSTALNNKHVETIQSVFGFRLDVDIENFDPKSPKFSAIGKVKLTAKTYKLLFIDEASMLNSKLVNYILNVCKKNKIKVIMCGDAKQLPPVNESVSRAFVVASKINYLTEIVRQEETNPIKNLLAILRKDIDDKTYKFFEYISNPKNKSSYNMIGAGYTICKKEEFEHLVRDSFTDERFKSNVDLYRIIAYTNAKVSYWNKYVRDIIVPYSTKGIITKDDLIMAYNTILNDFGETVIINSDDYIVKEISDFVDIKYGFKSYLVKFQAVKGGYVTPKLCVIDHNDRYTVQLYSKVINELINEAQRADSSKRVSAWKEYYKFKKTYILATNFLDNKGRITHSRDIDYGFAITSHRSQGSTYETVFVDVNDIVYDKYNRPYTNSQELLRRLYVACSRPTKELILCFG